MPRRKKSSLDKLFQLTDLLTEFSLFFAVLAIIMCVATWGMDLANMVYHCPYCRVQRTIIGLLGIALLLPKHKNNLLIFISFILAYFSADISGDQMFLSVKEGTFPTINFFFASGALAYVSILMYLIWVRFKA